MTGILTADELSQDIEARQKKRKNLKTELVKCAAEAVRIKFLDESGSNEIDERCNRLAIRLRDLADSL